MTLVHNWRAVLRHAWSVRFIMLGIMCSGAVAALPALAGDLPPRVFALLTFLVTIGALAARLVAQPLTLPDGRDGGA